jgi:hypothetical protein
MFYLQCWLKRIEYHVGSSTRGDDFFVVNLVIGEELYRDDLHCLNVYGYKSLVSQSLLSS